MRTYYSTPKVKNPNLNKDIIKFITPDKDELFVKSIISDKQIEEKIEILIDRIEFCKNICD